MDSKRFIVRVGHRPPHPSCSKCTYLVVKKLELEYNYQAFFGEKGDSPHYEKRITCSGTITVVMPGCISLEDKRLRDSILLQVFERALRGMDDNASTDYSENTGVFVKW